jgi:Zn-dependent M32 family carboxypeptidase
LEHSCKGYFDGDGTVEFSIHPFTIKVRLAFDENWRPHLEGLRQFLELRGIRCGVVRRKDGYNTWHVVVSNIEGVMVMAKRMLPYAAKKRVELKSILDYYEDRITGDQFVDTMNRLVLAGRKNWQVQRSRT